MLDTALEPAVRLTLVSAPPGYGKSVAVAAWISARRLPCAWLALEAATTTRRALPATSSSGLTASGPARRPWRI